MCSNLYKRFPTEMNVKGHVFSPLLLVGTHIQAMRGVEATTRQLLIAARQVCSTVQGIHLSGTRHTHKYKRKCQNNNEATKKNVATRYCFFNYTTTCTTGEYSIHKPLPQASGPVCVTAPNIVLTHQFHDSTLNHFGSK